MCNLNQYKNIVWSPEVKCPRGQVYSTCGDACSRSCHALADKASCKGRCSEGCHCPAGQTLDAAGACVPVEQCPCVHQGVEHRPGETVVRDTEDGGVETW